MTREERCKLAIEKGFKYNPITGEIISGLGKVIISKSSQGYNIIGLRLNKKVYLLLSHHFAWYVINKEIVDEIDHINGNRYDNRIINLRSVTCQQNHFNNTKAKGYTWDKSRNKWQSQIGLNNKVIHLGYYDTEDEARQSYLNAKQNYHIIK